MLKRQRRFNRIIWILVINKIKNAPTHMQIVAYILVHFLPLKKFIALSAR